MATTLNGLLKAERKKVIKGNVNDSVIGKAQKVEILRGRCDYGQALFTKSFVELYGLSTSTEEYSAQSPSLELQTVLQSSEDARKAICKTVRDRWNAIYDEVKACGEKGSVPADFKLYVTMALHYVESSEMLVHMERVKQAKSEEERAAYRQYKLAMRVNVPKERYEAYTAWKHVHREYMLDDEVLPSL